MPSSTESPNLKFEDVNVYYGLIHALHDISFEVPKGKIVTNYDNLIADIQTKRATVTTALDIAKQDAVNIDCSNSNPKTLISKFKQDMQSVKRALKDFRFAVRNLIVAVRSLQGEINKNPLWFTIDKQSP